MDATVALMLLLQAGAVTVQNPPNPYAYPFVTAPTYDAARPDPYGAALQNTLVAPWGGTVVRTYDGRYLATDDQIERKIGE